MPVGHWVQSLLSGGLEDLPAVQELHMIRELSEYLPGSQVEQVTVPISDEYLQEWEKKGGHITQKSEQLRDFLIEYMKGQLGDRPELLEQLVPDYAPMVRRPVVDNNWYQALTRDNVDRLCPECRPHQPICRRDLDLETRCVDHGPAAGSEVR